MDFDLDTMIDKFIECFRIWTHLLDPHPAFSALPSTEPARGIEGGADQRAAWGVAMNRGLLYHHH